MTPVIRALSPAEAHEHRPGLAALLTGCVAGGASIGFMWPFELSDAQAWWGEVVAAVGAGTTVLFAALNDTDVVGSAQLGLSFPPNQIHRGEVKKVMVRRDARGRGIGAALLAVVEAEAVRRGRTLLTLDTVTGSEADRLYRRLGWHEVGVIPNQAMFPDGRFCDATMFWKTPCQPSASAKA